MICIKTNKISRGDIEERITKWSVWFRTPFGLTKSLQEAVQAMEANEINPLLSIVPVAVAESNSTYEVWERG